MLTAEFLSTIQLNQIPQGQIWWAKVLSLNYALPRKTEVVVEGIENLPTDRRVFLAMNHTDRYNSWPLQHHLHLSRKEYTCTWVKGKYYLNPLVRTFLLSTNNIPLASRGYVISSRFKKAMNRSPNGEEYRFIRNLLDNNQSLDQISTASSSLQQFLGDQPQNRLDALRSDFAGMSNEVIRLNKQAFELGHHILVFPEGTRSIRLGKGHTGLAQMAQRLGVDIVPIGCSGSSKCYPGAIPWAKGGRIVYRIGKPISLDSSEFSPMRVTDKFIPFSSDAQQKYGQSFQQLTDTIMDQINELLDPEHQRDVTGKSQSEDNRIL